MAENQEMSPVERKVAQQVEVILMLNFSLHLKKKKNDVQLLKNESYCYLQYYFGDHNLPRDKFLKEQLQQDDGWVPLETMLKFNRFVIPLFI